MANPYVKTRFALSVRDLNRLPPDEGREVAFAGRSNAGKSSALNALTQQKALARISKTPGRTQLINFFMVEAERCLVDLPGYGYARVPDAVKRDWRILLEGYLGRRRALQGLFLLMDARHPLTELDSQMLAWCRPRALPIHILLTKADKLSRGAALAALRQVQNHLRLAHSETSAQLFSSVSGWGLEEAHQRLDEWLGYAPAATD